MADLEDPYLRWLWAFLAVACVLLGWVTVISLSFPWWAAVLIAVGIFAITYALVEISDRYL